MVIWIWPCVVVLLSLSCFLYFTIVAVLTAIKTSSDSAFCATGAVIQHMKESHAHLSRKLESWHESSISASSANAERMAELLASDVSERYAQTQLHAKERAEAVQVTANRATNDRIADANEVIANNPQPEKKVVVKPSKAQVSRANADRGQIAESYRTRT